MCLARAAGDDMTRGTFVAPVRIEGLAELRKSLKSLDADQAKGLRLDLNEAAGIVVRVARPRVPTRTGAAAGSIKVSSTQGQARVAAGGNKAPYYPWLDYGGRTGRKKANVRRFERHGRYLYPAYWSQAENITRLLSKKLAERIRGAGLESTPDA